MQPWQELTVTLRKASANAPVGLNLVNGDALGSPPIVKSVGGLALRSGLQANDCIVAVNDEPVLDHASAAALIRAAPELLVVRLKRAAMAKDTPLLRALMGSGTPSAPPERSKQPTALHTAARSGDALQIARILDKGGVSMNATDATGWTPLHCACQTTSTESVRVLLERGADVLMQTDIKATALHIAAFNGRLPISKLLVLHGADIHMKDREGYTPLDDARYRSLDRCCAVETPDKQWTRVVAFLKQVDTMALDEQRAFARRSWRLWVAQLLQTRGEDLLRLKGILAMRGHARKFVCHGVHMVFEGAAGGEWSAGQPRASRLVLIGRNLVRRDLQAAFARCEAAPETCRPAEDEDEAAAILRALEAKRSPARRKSS